VDQQTCRGGEDDPPNLVTCDRIEVDRRSGRAYRNGADLNLTAQELAVLEVLIGARGRVVSPGELLDGAWTESNGSATTVRGMVHRLRRKLGTPSPIVTETSSGYRWAYCNENRDPEGTSCAPARCDDQARWSNSCDDTI
jgi:DNA-binding response OmpR family regulator